MLFPKTIASGLAFCNRSEERSRLRDTITQIQPSLVVSPRRYGKTSLIVQVLEDLKWPYAHIDLFLAFDREKITERFLAGIAELIPRLMPLNIKALNKIKDCFKRLSVSLVAGHTELAVRLEPSHKTDTLRDAIQGVELLLAKHKKTAVIFVDELQDIVKTEYCGEVEAILRFYAQKTKRIAFIFSGSNRKLLREIFEDRARPLFKLCEKMTLRRISFEHYQAFIQKAAKKKWSQSLPVEVLEMILNLTECHAYYINYLCANVWRYAEIPTAQQVEQAWVLICQEEASGVANDLALFSLNQKRILEFVAAAGQFTLSNSKQIQFALKLTQRGVQQSLKGLLDYDLLEEYEPGVIRVTDPLMRSVLVSD